MTATECLLQCTIEGNVIKLPNTQLDRKEYGEVKKKLELIGGKWKGGKVFGFVFPHDPTDLLASINNGESRNLKKEYQFFATPDALAGRLVELANIDYSHTILEPSAGQGAIVKAIRKYTYNAVRVDCFELMMTNRLFLEKIECARIIGVDFLTCGTHYDRIVANPPFANNQDIDHIYKMYECLNDGGRIVTIASLHWKHSNNKKEKAFRKWLQNKESTATVIELQGGEFKESGTNIKACIIIIDK